MLKTWAVYFVLLIPFIVEYFTNRDAITARFREVSYITPAASWWTIIKEFVSAYISDISPAFMLVNGDHLLRHHIPVMGGILAATFLLALVGFVIVLIRHRRDAWWQFILYGLVVSILPGALTVHRQHFLRLLAVPILLLILSVPAISALIGERRVDSAGGRPWPKLLGRGALAVLLVLTLIQVGYFQYKFQKWQPERKSYFNSGYRPTFNKAMEETLRPVYLQDGRYGPGYILALWYAAVDGVDKSNFVHMREGAAPPPDSLILGSVTECSHCYEIFGSESFLLYQTKGSTARPGVIRPGASVPDETLTPVVFGAAGSAPGQFSRPRGIAADKEGNFYIADAGNGRVQKFDSNRQFVTSFDAGSSGSEDLKEPEGVAVDDDGNIYVTDIVTHKLIKLGPNGRFIMSWRGADTGFYGPRDIARGPNDQLFIVDSGRSRIVRFDMLAENFIAWGAVGSEESKFSGISGITVADDLVIVVDTGNKRVQAFDFDGNFIRQWSIDAWGDKTPSWPDAVFDAEKKALYITNGLTKEMMGFDLDGNRVAGISFDSKEQFGGVSGVTIAETQKKRLLMMVDTGGAKVYVTELGDVKPKKPETKKPEKK